MDLSQGTFSRTKGLIVKIWFEGIAHPEHNCPCDVELSQEACSFISHTIIPFTSLMHAHS